MLISIELTFTKQFWILKKNLRWCDWSLQRWISSCRQFFSSFSSLYSPPKCTKYDIWEKVHVIWFWCDWLETHNSIFSLFAFLNSYETCKIGPPLEDVHSLPFGVVLYADMIVHQSLSKLEHSAQFTVLKYTLNKILNIPPYEYNLWKIAK